MFFSVILILLIAFVFRKQKMDETGQLPPYLIQPEDRSFWQRRFLM